MNVQTEVPVSDPMRAAWERYKQTQEYVNTRRWALHDEHVDGSLWAAFREGWALALRQADRDPGQESSHA